MIEEIKKFLNEKPGYLKEGAERLQDILAKKDMYPTVEQCRIALQEGRVNFKKQQQEEEKEEVKFKVLIYDIETSYNIVKSWRVGYNLNINPGDIIKERAIICVSYKWLGEEEIYSLAWDKNQDDRFLLEQFIEVLNEADLIVAHNGDRYDLKFIKTRAIFHGLSMYLNYPQFDTLKVAKKKFMFNSNKLDYIADFLGYGNKIKTEMKLWDDIIFNSCPEAMKKMIEYCNKDVKLLEEIYIIFKDWEKNKQHVGVLAGQPTYSSPNSGTVDISLVKTITTPAGTIKRIMKDNVLGTTFEMSDTNYRKFTKEVTQ